MKTSRIAITVIAVFGIGLASGIALTRHLTENAMQSPEVKQTILDGMRQAGRDAVNAKCPQVSQSTVPRTSITNKELRHILEAK